MITKDAICDMVNGRTFSNEGDVKAVVRLFFEKAGGFVFMPAANGYGVSGVSDFVGLRNGVPIAIETKFGDNKATPLQMKFAERWLANGGRFYLINEKNIARELYAICVEIKDD